MKHLLFLAVSLSIAFTASCAFAYTSPGKPTGHVNDYTGTLNAETKTNLEGLLTRFQASEKGEVAVAIVSTLSGDVIENYSVALAREWGIGAKGKDNGVLLLVVKDDRELRIEVGYGFEGILTDAKSSRIIREVITPRFKAGQYDEGVSDGVKAIIGALDPTFDGGFSLADAPPVNTTQFSASNLPVVVLFLYFAASILSLVASILGRSKSWWLGGVLGAALGGYISFAFVMNFIPVVALTLIGLFFDFVVSRGYQNSVEKGTRPPWWTGGSGGFGGGGSSGFGGFSGGSFGGGGSSGRW